MRNLLVAGLGLLAVAEATAQPRVGERFVLTPADMPVPYATSSATNPAYRASRPEGYTLSVPEGFVATLYADKLAHPRWLTVLPDGAVLVAESNVGKITRLSGLDDQGRATSVTTFAEGFDRPHGLAVHQGAVYVADTARVWRLALAPDGTRVIDRTPLTPEGALGEGSGHWTRNLAFAPDGRSFVVAIGSRGNIAEEPSPRATIQRFATDGRPLGTVATGLRNPVGIAFHPTTGALYTVVNERDGMGDGLVPDFLTRVEQGGFYGWPYAYIGRNPDPRYGARRPDLVVASLVPDLLFISHSAPIGLVFYDGDQFPAAYRGDAFVALQGSWNAAEPQGYMVARVPFKDGRPAGDYEAFATGFWRTGKTPPHVIGQPAGLAVAKDGALLVADDSGRAVWRIAHRR
ncbi:MAG: sorbosone dehydrogenase [Alphaproteobacteria bacterium]|nr:sorbosone dehydrogenase [Alphaproteobacteria bacterium]